jgi:hypothetical protein
MEILKASCGGKQEENPPRGSALGGFVLPLLLSHTMRCLLIIMQQTFL